MSNPSPAEPADDGLPCPQCGYDLRALASRKCPECGLEIDLDQLKESGVPWAHRRKLGRLKSYVRTVWAMALDTKRVRMEASKPQALADALAMQRATSLIVAIVMTAILSLALWQGGGRVIFAAQTSGQVFATPTREQRLVTDVIVPWSAGATRPGLMFLAVAGFAVSLVRSPAALFASGAISPARREVGRAMAVYAFSLIALLLPAMAPAAVIFVPELLQDRQSQWDFLLTPFLVICWTVLAVLFFLAIGGAIVRPLTWFKRVTHLGFGSLVIASMRWAGTIFLAAVCWLYILPYCVGFLWIVIDSFRV